MVLPFVGNVFRKIFGTRNDRLVKRYQAKVGIINSFEAQMRSLTDPQLRQKTQELRDRHANGESMEQLRPEALSVPPMLTS